MTPQDLESFVRSFVRRDRRARWLTLLASKKGRKRLTFDLDHGLDFDERFTQPLAPQLTQEEVVALLQKKGAGSHCALLSSNTKIDGQTLELDVAIERIYGGGFGTYVICQPLALAYFESENGSRYLLERSGQR